MPTYIYVHPDTQEEVEIFHAMSEVKNPTEKLLQKITLPDGRMMQRKIVAPALLGFDNLGRSVKKSESNGSTEIKAESKPENKTKSEPVAKAS
ncbi:MAG: hypothetical protein ACOCXH_08040 [Cyclobacteriaceae bacterium]